MDTEKHIQRAISIGEANKRTLALVTNWCAHLKVSSLGRGGLVEQSTGLPIGPRSLSCPHAAAHGMAGVNLQFVAIDFHDRNCVGCSHRRPVGLPNLSTLIHERDAAREATAAEEGRREAAAVAALQARDAIRQTIRADLTPPSRNVIDQIEELDQDRNNANADRLVETAKLAPDVFTPRLLEYAFDLVETGESWFDNAGLRLLKALNVDKSRLTRCALLCLPRFYATEIAAEILLENLGLADEVMVGTVVPTLITMANPRRSYLVGPGPRPNPIPLIRVYAAFPKAVETAIAGLFDGADTHNVSQAARGIIVLADQDKILPGRFARSVVGKFIRDRRLLQASEHNDGDGETLNELRHAIALAFEEEPIKIDGLLTEFLEGASEIGEARIFSIYRGVLHGPRHDESAAVTEATRLALKRVVWCATKTNSYLVLQEISNLLSGLPWGLATLAAEEVQGLLGAAIIIDSKLQSMSAGPSLEDPTGRTAMDLAMRRDNMRNLRESLIRWAATGAGQGPEEAKAYLEVLAGLPSEEKNAVKIDMVGHLDQLMHTAEGLTAALPHLYTAMVGTSVAARARAVAAVGEIDYRQKSNLPGLVFEAFMALLFDPYRMVHQYAAHALRRTNLPNECRPRAKLGLLTLIRSYARDRDNDRFLIECLDLYIDAYADLNEFGSGSSLWLISVLEKIEPYLVAGEISTFGRVLREHDGYVRLLIRLMGDDTAWHSRQDDLMRALSDLPIHVVRRNLQELEAFASMAGARDRHIDGLFIELFTRAGAWKEAEKLARAAAAALPDDAWNRPRKLGAEQMRLATEFETALAAGLTERTKSLAADWEAISNAIEKERRDNAERRDPLRGLRG